MLKLIDKDFKVRFIIIFNELKENNFLNNVYFNREMGNFSEDKIQYKKEILEVKNIIFEIKNIGKIQLNGFDREKSKFI